MFQALLAAVAIALLSLVGVFFFGKEGAHLSGTHRFVLPAAVGVFLGVVFFELIPETLERTNLGRLGQGDRVNIELDVIARYVEKMVSPYEG